MQCSKCQFENPEGIKFCGECGARLERLCPSCNSQIPPNFKFCGECGYNLIPAKEFSEQKSMAEKLSTRPSTKISSSDVAFFEGERKHVTVLFSDLSGYTTLSEKLDPEEVKEITSKIFSKISKIVVKYDGFIEKYAGDAVMALFGVPRAHEDDPIRAVKAAREIHELVDAVSPEVESKIGQPISMHTGINTGLVVTGGVDMERGTHGVAGDTINIASRLSNLAKPGEILIDVDTCRQTEGHFACEYMEATTIKGKAVPVQVHKVLAQRDKPVTIRRLSGLRADLIGRKVELAELAEAFDNLREGRGSIFSICGAAGTGKSRLVEEFKATLELEKIQWIEGHAYAYSQNIPYFPMIDLLNRVLHIEENDPPEKVREKVESGIEYLVGKQEEIVPYVGGLYSLSYAEVEEVSPEFWKSRLQTAIKVILSTLASKAPTIYFLEDLHWADPSFVELLRQSCLEIRQPAIVLCVYRPTFSLFTGDQLAGVGKYYHEMQLQNLSSSESHDMLESLLKTKKIPSDLKRLVQSKAEGNPFYLEELVNALIESEKLIRDNGHWRITQSISEADVSSSIHGLISGRLDRLDGETKRILQEASVIGRAFLYEILIKITELKDSIDGELVTLERMDMIRTRALQPDIEYMFKHPLTQEVVYNGLLKKDRQAIHEQIGVVMEQLFQDRLPEFYETLAFHFENGRSLHKAVDYLTKSGEKSLKRYSVEESHQYFKEAFEFLASKSDKTKKEDELLIDLLIQWALVFYYRGDFKELLNLLNAHQDLAESLNDKGRLGMFYAWQGFAMDLRERLMDSYDCLCKALKLGEEIQSQKVIGYACAWLAWTCQTMGLFDEAIRFGERAKEIARLLPSDHYLYFKCMAGIGYTYYGKGERKRTMEVGRALLDYGKIHSNLRSMAVGHMIMGCGHAADGNFQLAIESAKKATQIAADPFYYQMSRTLLGIVYTQNDQFNEAEEVFRYVLSYSQEFGCEIIGTVSSAMLGIVSIAKGQMNKGLKQIEKIMRVWAGKQRRGWHANMEQSLGKFYLQIALAEGPKNLSLLAKNVGFLIRNAPFASQKAEKHFNNAIEIAKGIGAKGTLGQAHFNLGLLHSSKGRTDKAKEFVSKAIELFEQCEAEIYLNQAKEVLQSFG